MCIYIYISLERFFGYIDVNFSAYMQSNTQINVLEYLERFFLIFQSIKMCLEIKAVADGICLFVVFFVIYFENDRIRSKRSW